MLGQAAYSSHVASTDVHVGIHRLFDNDYRMDGECAKF